MSSQGPLGGRARQALPTVPKGETVATFETYPEAQAAVDVLVRADFPLAQVSIIGSDLKTVERVTGKLTWGRAAAAGAASGVWLGIFFGLLLMIFSPAASLGIVLAALLLGAGFGMLFGVVSYAITRRRRDYTSLTQVLATSYSIIVDPDLANRARNLLDNAGAASFATGAPGRGDGRYVPPEHPSDPPRAWEPPRQGQGSENPTHPGDDNGSGDDRPSRAGGPSEPPRYGERVDDPPADDESSR
ncbi:general stress protein [Humibacter ginsenosidimutans]|uniref:general stress protein n=1 Tax=Humibacter ginsenosidimutans TaxID=2599293 RepID=UPI001FEF138A|nr:general stress protein [Humibacter ginsenosidimutans]